jgi:DNA-binding LytR/AlgR family response regulator
MTRLPHVYDRFTTQLWYIFLIPAFFFLFVVIYRPFDMYPALEMGRGLFFFNATMLMCIQMGVLLVTRSLFYLMHRHRKRNWWECSAWFVLELTAISYLSALYLFLMSRQALPYFEQLALCVQYTFLSLLFPYVIITLVCVIVGQGHAPETLQGKDVIRFTDASRQVRLALDKRAVLFIKAEENYVKIHYTENGSVKDFQLRSTMHAMEPLASRYGLFRCQRSYFVNPDHITALRKDVGGLMTAELDAGGFIIPVSKALYRDLSHLI